MSDRVGTAAAIALTIILVTGAVAPVVGYERPETPTRDRTIDRRALDAGAYSASLLSEREPLVKKRAATAIVRDLNASKKRQERQRDRAYSLVNGTLSDYRDPTRIERESVIQDDAAAVKALSAFAGTDQASDVETATQLITAADNETASQAITDAERALARTEGDVSPPGKRQAAKSHLENARRAYDRAQKALEKSEDGTLKQRLNQRSKALRQLATAWRQAQKALDALDAGTEPEVVIQTRADPVRNNSSTTERRIVGYVFDVRGYELSNATVTVDGNRTFTVPLNTSTAPGTNATFDFNVTLDDRVTTVNVSVTDAPIDGDDEEASGDQLHGGESEGEEGDDEGEEGGDGEGEEGEDDGGDGEEESDGEDGGDTQVGADVLRLDGDGLPGEFEATVTKTDPLDFDSDSRETDTNEADNGTIDGSEDYDGDTLAAFDEWLLGTSPFAVTPTRHASQPNAVRTASMTSRPRAAK